MWICAGIPLGIIFCLHSQIDKGFSWCGNKEACKRCGKAIKSLSVELTLFVYSTFSLMFLHSLCTLSPTFGLAPHRLHPRNMIPPLWLPRSTHPQPRCVLASPFLSACTSLLARKSPVKADSSAVIYPICVTCCSVRGPNVAKLKVEKDPQNED